MTATKYGTRERIRNSKTKNEVVTNFSPFAPFSLIAGREVLRYEAWWLLLLKSSSFHHVSDFSAAGVCVFFFF